MGSSSQVTRAVRIRLATPLCRVGEPQLETPEYLKVLRRCGCVLFALGSIDLAAVLVETNLLKASTLQGDFLTVRAVGVFIAGMVLWTGSHGAAYVIRWLSLFVLSGAIVGSSMLLLLQPLGLTVAIVERATPDVIIRILMYSLGVAICYWLQRQLVSDAVVQELRRWGTEIGSMKSAPYLAVTLVLVFVFENVLSVSREREHAVNLAERQFGERYRYYARSVSVREGRNGKSFSANVVAWDDHELKSIPVSWQE